MRDLGKGKNATLKLFAVLNIDKPKSHVTWAKNTEKLVETSSEVTNSNMEMAAKEVHSMVGEMGFKVEWPWNTEKNG